MSLKKLNSDYFYGYKVVLRALDPKVLFSIEHVLPFICLWGKKQVAIINADFSYAYCFQQRPPVDEVLREGHINLSGLQLRAHAMFSAEGLPLGSDSLEYAWLIDVQAGSLTAKVTAPQVCSQVSECYPCLPFSFPDPRPQEKVVCPFECSFYFHLPLRIFLVMDESETSFSVLGHIKLMGIIFYSPV